MKQKRRKSKNQDRSEREFSKLMRDIENERTDFDTMTDKSPCFIFQLHSIKLEDYDETEIIGLAQSAGYDIVHYFDQSGTSSSKFFLRRGRVKQISALLNEVLTDAEIEGIAVGDPDKRKDKTSESEADMEDTVDDDYYQNLSEAEIDQILQAEEGSLASIADEVLDEIIKSASAKKDSENKMKDKDKGEDEEDEEYKPWADPEAERTALEKMKDEFKLFYYNINTLDSNDRTNLTAIFNNRLNHMQLINLSKEWEIKVIDRDQLILEIFERNARTKEAYLQIQLAKMNFETAKLKKDIGTIISEKQGKDFMGAGMAAWVPMYKSLRDKKGWIERKLQKIKQDRQVQRKNRNRLFNVAIVGYTNAGKSTFMNWITKTKQEITDSEFTTATPKTAAINYPVYDEEGNFLSFEKMTLTDTVGFIYDIPHVLIDSFLSTLEEIKYTNCILIMIDISERDEIKIKKKIDTCITTIRAIGAEEIPMIYVINKADLVPAEELEEKVKLILSFVPKKDYVIISSTEKQGFNDLLLKLVNLKKRLGFVDD